MTRTRWVMLAVAVCAIALWWTGSLDRPLSSVGLNSETCAQNLFGATICGDDLVAFCKDSYDPDINADVCDEVLRDAGSSPAEVLAGQRATDRARARRAQDATLEARFNARIKTGMRQSAALGDLTYRVVRARRASRTSGSTGAILPRAGNQLVIADITYRNDGSAPVDLLCGGGSNFRLVDVHGRSFSTDSDAMFDAPRNDETCARDLQPGELEDATLIFQVPRSTQPADVLIGQPDDPPPGGTERYLVVNIR